MPRFELGLRQVRSLASPSHHVQTNGHREVKGGRRKDRQITHWAPFSTFFSFLSRKVILKWRRLTEVERITRRQGEDHQSSKSPLHKIRPDRGSERFCRHPEVGPWKDTLSVKICQVAEGRYRVRIAVLTCRTHVSSAMSPRGPR